MLSESIKTGPGNFFVYIELPKELQARYAPLSRSLGGSGDVDHVTVLYIPQNISLDPSCVQHAIDAISIACKNHGPLRARVQGWAYFDGAEEGMTALVALLDVPGLTELHVDVKRAVAATSIKIIDSHGFTPHATFAYVPNGTSPGLRPIFDDEFIVHELCIATDKITRVSLGTGGIITESLKMSIKNVVGKINEEWWDQNYKDVTTEDDLMLNRDSVIVPTSTKRAIKKWLHSMGLLGDAGDPHT